MYLYKNTFYEVEHGKFLIASNYYHLRIGIRRLVQDRPCYCAFLFEQIVRRIHLLIHNEAKETKRYSLTLVDEWFINRISRNDLATGKNRTISKETVEVALDYSKIYVKYVLLNGKPSLRLPAIRLSDDNLSTANYSIYYGETLVSSDTLGINGNELGRTIQSKTIPQYDLYGRYEAITNDEVKFYLDALVSEKLIRSKGGYSLTKEGTAVITANRPEALDNPYIKANETAERGEEYQYIGQYACYYRLDVFRKKSLNELLDKLEGYHSKVSPYPLEPEQVRAWTDCYKTLQECFKTMPKQYENLYVVFEYVLPNHKPGSKRSEGDIGVRSDVVLVSNKATLVLEFKQRSEDFEGFVLQAKKYKTRLDRYHEQARTMRNHSVLVLTKAKKHLKKHDGVTTCSKDYLSDIIQIIFENDCERHEDIKGWLHSAFID